MDRLIDLLREVVDDDRNPVAIVSDHCELSYNGLLESVDNCAARLQEHHPQAGPVGICMNMSPEYVVAMFTCLSLGRTFVPLNPNYPSDRLSAIASQTGCTSVFFGSLETPPPAWATARGVLNLRRQNGQFALDCMNGAGSETSLVPRLRRRVPRQAPATCISR